MRNKVIHFHQFGNGWEGEEIRVEKEMTGGKARLKSIREEVR